MSHRSRDQSIHGEPHLQDRAFESDPSEQRTDKLLHSEALSTSADEFVEHTVWDEPTIAPELTGAAGEDQLTYARWLDQKIVETSGIKSWLVTLLVVAIAGPLGVFGAIFGSGFSGAGLAMVIIAGPVTEEVMKVVGALWIVEKRPYLFKSVWQILLCAAAGGAAFGFIENLMYLHWYIPNPSSKLAHWRWTVCMGLHMNCSFVAGVGVARIWYNAVRERHRPQLWLGLPWLFMAMVAHGAYNGFTVLAESLGWLEF